jgi:hypothetical protein
MVGGLLLATLGYGSLALLSRPGVGYAALVAPLVIPAVGNSVAFPAISAVIATTVSPGHLGAASGANTTIREIDGILGIAVVTLAFTAAGSFRNPHTVIHTFQAAIALCAATSLPGAVLDSRVPGRPRRADSATFSPSARHQQATR